MIPDSCPWSRCFARNGRWGYQVLCRHNLPVTIAAYPDICPDTATALRFTTAPYPAFAALRHWRVPKESQLDVVQMVGGEVLGCSGRFRDRLRLVIWAARRYAPRRADGAE